MDLGGISIWQLIILTFVVLIPTIIFIPVVKKAGYSRWWAILAGLPVIALVALWLFAFSNWPAERNS